MNIQTIDIEPTTICDLSCPFCFGPKIKKRALDLNIEVWKNALVNFKNIGVKNIVVSGGEPLLREDLFELMHFAQRELGFNTVLSTHGRFVDKVLVIAEVCNWIALPIDGFSPETINYMRTDDFSNENVILLCKELKRIYPNIKIKIGTVATKKNFEEIEQIAELLKANRKYFDTWKLYQYMPRRKFKKNSQLLSISDSEFLKLKKQVSKVVDNSFRTYFSGIQDRLNAYLFVYHDGTVSLVNIGDDYGDLNVGNIQDFTSIDFSSAQKVDESNHINNFNKTY